MTKLAEIAEKLTSIRTDPIYGASNFEREEGDRYWTEPWVTTALLNLWSLPEGRVWEPAAGRGDMVQVLQDFGFDTYASDINMSEYLGPDPCGMVSFLKGDLQAFFYACREHNINSIITNPPYKGKLADQFVSQAIHLMETDQIEMAAFLLRAEWNAAKKRARLFDHEFYAGEVVLRKRPRWDWWYADKSEHGPRHNFSWFIWDNKTAGRGNPVQLFQKVDE